MKADSDLGQRLSESCVKTVLALLALSAVTFGIAQRIENLGVFNSYRIFLNARADLELLTESMASDACWQKYVASLADPSQAQQTTFAELKQIECTPHHDQMRINRSKSIEPSPLDPASLEFMTPVKDASAREGWYPQGSLEILERTLIPFWDDAALDRARAYSVVAADDVYRWRLQRFQLQQLRGLPLLPVRLANGPALSEANFLGLRVTDLTTLSRSSRAPLSDLDRGTTAFQTSLPSVPVELDLGLAAQAVSIALAIFMAVLAGYVRVADAHGAFSQIGTIFHVMLGSRFTMLVGMLVSVVPAAAVYRLTEAIYSNQSSVATCLVFGTAVAWATFSMLRRFEPHVRGVAR